MNLIAKNPIPQEHHGYLYPTSFKARVFSLFPLAKKSFFIRTMREREKERERAHARHHSPSKNSI
jgi:hypothetical protein